MKLIIYAANVVRIAELLNGVRPRQIQIERKQGELLITSLQTSLKEFKQPISHHALVIEQLDDHLNCLIKLSQSIFNHLNKHNQAKILKKLEKCELEKLEKNSN